ncbi:Arc family DNA-binding protein [Mesorhizobium sp. A556]
MAKPTRVRDYDQFVVRLPDGMRERISQAADHNARSMNAEIITRLEQTFDPSMISEEIADQIEALHQCETALDKNREDLNKANEIRELLGKYVQSTERQNEALRKAGLISEQLVIEFAHAISRAAEGELDELQRLVEREKSQPTLKKLVTVWSIVRED